MQPFCGRGMGETLENMVKALTAYMHRGMGYPTMVYATQRAPKGSRKAQKIKRRFLSVSQLGLVEELNLSDKDVSRQ